MDDLIRAPDGLNRNFSTEALRQDLISRFAIPQAARLVVAHSGGADSQVLLHSLALLSREMDFAVLAAHYDHGLHPDSDNWKDRCESWSRNLGIDFLSDRWQKPDTSGQSLEAEARNARYQWLDAITCDSDIVVTAHHADDQAETFLLHLFQGKSLGQLAGIAESRSLTWGSGTRLIRPLLRYTRAQLLEYAGHNNIQWIEDPSNYSLTHYRNYIRHELAPLLYARNPALKSQLVDAARKCAGIARVWLSEHEEHLQKNLVPKRRGVFCVCTPLDLRFLRKTDAEELADIIRLWLHDAGLASLPGPQSRSLVEQIQRNDSAGFEFHSQGKVIRYYDNTLFLTPNLVSGNPGKLAWDPEKPVCWKDQLKIEASAKMKSFLHTMTSQAEIHLQWRKGGEKFKQPGRQHRSSLKKLLQENRVLPWERNLLPFPVMNSRILWVNGIGESEEARQWLGLENENPGFFLEYSCVAD